jgi:hypothetical protein
VVIEAFSVSGCDCDFDFDDLFDPTLVNDETRRFAVDFDDESIYENLDNWLDYEEDERYDYETGDEQWVE